MFVIGKFEKTRFETGGHYTIFRVLKIKKIKN